MSIREKLNIIQKLSKLTQTELAIKLNVSFPTLNSWINEKSKPRDDKLEKINKLYLELSGQSIIHEDPLKARKEIIELKKKKERNVIKLIQDRKDLHDQIVLSFTYNSNSIEGSTLTESDTAAIIFHKKILKNKHLIEHLEAKNHQTALEYLFKTVKKDFLISEELILKLHSILMNSIRDDAGFYRNHGVRIVGSNVPTANYMKIPQLMSQLIKKINKKEKDTISHATLIHSKFEKIHPFSDGNGRIGRILMAAMLLRKNYAPAIIEQKKKNFYYKYLQLSQQKEEHTKLEEFICDAVLNGFSILEV